MLKRDTLALTAVLAFLTALGPLSTDMYLPSLPAIGRALGAPVAGVQLTLSSSASRSGSSSTGRSRTSSAGGRC